MICRRDANITKLIANGIATKDGLHKLDNILGKDEATLGDLMKAFDNLNFDPLDNESIGKSGTLNFLKFKENDNVSGLMVYEASLGEDGARNFKINHLLDIDRENGKLCSLGISDELTTKAWVDEALKVLICHVAARPPWLGKIYIETKVDSLYLRKLMEQYDGAKIRSCCRLSFSISSTIFNWSFSLAIDLRQDGNGQGSSSGNKEGSSQDEEMKQKVVKQQPRYLTSMFCFSHHIHM